MNLIAIYPASSLLGRKDPRVITKLNGYGIQLLLDQGAHVSVVPKIMMDVLNPNYSSQTAGKAVRVFCGQNIVWNRPTTITVELFNTKTEHRIYFVSNDIVTSARKSLSWSLIYAKKLYGLECHILSLTRLTKSCQILLYCLLLLTRRHRQQPDGDPDGE